jgi:hypothetical protein
VLRAVQLEECQATLLAPISWVGDELGDGTLGTSKELTTSLNNIPVLVHLEVSDPVFGERVHVPGIQVLVDVARDAGDVEGEGVLSRNGKRRAKCWVCVDGQLEVAPCCGVVGDVEEELSVSL